MTPTQVEQVYDGLAQTLDTVGQEKSELFLAKLALLLAREIGDPGRVLGLIVDASANLDAAE